MKRLIDAHDFWIRLPINAENITLADVTEALGGTPTVDAEPVRYGRWIEHSIPNSWTGQKYWTCSECNFGEENHNWVRSNYCPVCGANMGGEDLTKIQNCLSDLDNQVKNKMDKETYIRAILECNFAGFKDEIIETAVRKILKYDNGLRSKTD